MTTEDDRKEVELVIPVTLHVSRTVTSTCGSEYEVRDRILDLQELLESKVRKGRFTDSKLEVAEVDSDYGFALELNEDQLEKFEE